MIYPGVDVDFYKSKSNRHKENGGYWLSVNRLYPQKRIELQIEAFKQLPDEKLIIVGGYAKGDHAWRYIKKLKLLEELPENITYLGTVPEEELSELYGNCRGFITTAQDEDFGLTPIESMACGCPVIAWMDGAGPNQTVVNNINGLFV